MVDEIKGRPIHHSFPMTLFSEMMHHIIREVSRAVDLWSLGPYTITEWLLYSLVLIIRHVICHSTVSNNESALVQRCIAFPKVITNAEITLRPFWMFYLNVTTWFGKRNIPIALSMF